MDSLNRRELLKLVSGAVTTVALHPQSAFGVAKSHSSAPLPVAGIPGSAVRNKAPLAANTFDLLPLGAVRPSGWLRRQLEIQATGLGGHLDETWADVGPNSGWLGGTGESWERGPYFLDGLVPLAYLLNDDRLKLKVQKYIDWTLNHQAANGMIGPPGNDDWWPRMVMLKVLTQYHEATGDSRVIPVLSRYFAHQLETLPVRPLRDWGKFRWQDNALVVIWLYNRTGDEKLIELLKLLHAQGFNWKADFADFKYTQAATPEQIRQIGTNGLGDYALATHGVNNGQALKTDAVWSLVSGLEDDRRGMQEMLTKLDTYHGLPNGMFACDEHLAGRNPSQGTELCTVVETMFSLEQGLAILGSADLGDRLEKIAFNALPGTFTDDMWAHQYNQQSNQVEVSLHRKPWTTDGPESNLYGLEPNFGCCAANFHQGWPKFTASLWMASQDNGLVAAVYSPSEVRTTIGKTPVHVVEETEYPFRGSVRITVNPASEVKFPMRLRVPAWAGETLLKVNGQAEPLQKEGGYAKIDRLWKPGDVIEIDFAMKPRVVQGGFHDSISVERGPLVFSYPIGEDWVKLRTRGMTADWQVFPSTEWNYALAVPEATADAISVHEQPVGGSPFALNGTPVRLQVSARKIPAWQAVDGVADAVPQSPIASKESLEIISLVPYGAAKLRITAFPRTS